MHIFGYEVECGRQAHTINSPVSVGEKGIFQYFLIPGFFFGATGVDKIFLRKISQRRMMEMANMGYAAVTASYCQLLFLIRYIAHNTKENSIPKVSY